MIFNWMKQRRHNKILTTPFSESWQEIIESSVLQIEFLTEAQQARHRRLTQIFVVEKNWEGCNGLDLTEEMKVVIAAMACLLVVGLADDEHFDNVLSILVFPDSYVAKNTQLLGSGTVIEGPQARSGEAWYRGPVIVSWADVEATAQNRTWGRNVVLHEFAHQLDMLNGRSADGQPILPSQAAFESWKAVMDDAYERLVENCQSGQSEVIDCYGATNPAEFFAVTSELFFEAPTPLRHWHPEVYEQLCFYYGLNPANWGT